MVNSKLRKLVITPFNGTHADWLRFWNQFEAEIDSTQIPMVTKFSYLKELVEKKVRMSIDGLPFNSEGYERAKNILKSRYAKISEIVNAYVQAISALPHIHGSQPAKIYDFYEKLLRNVQALETLRETERNCGLCANDAWQAGRHQRRPSMNGQGLGRVGLSPTGQSLMKVDGKKPSKAEWQGDGKASARRESVA